MKNNIQSYILFCDKVMEYSMYLIVFFVPISKAMIEGGASIAILAFIAKKILTRTFLPSESINKYLFLYVAMCVLSILFSTDIQLSLKTLFFKLLEVILIYFVVIEVFGEKRKIYTALVILFLSAMLVCVDGFYQYITNKDFLRQRNWPYDLKPFTLRISGPFMTKNDLAAYLAPLVVFSWGIFFVKFKAISIKFISKVILVLLSICLGLTVSRAAGFAVFTGLIFLGIFSDKRFFVFLLTGIIIFTFLCWISPTIKKEVGLSALSSSDAGGSDRRVLTKISLNMFRHSPIFGLGLGTYMANFEKFNDNDKKTYPGGPSYAHNCYLQMAAEIGLLGLSSFLLFLAVLFFRSIKQFKKAKISLEKYIFIALLASIFTYLVHSYFDTNLYNLDIGMFFWLILGLLASQSKLLEREMVIES